MTQRNLSVKHSESDSQTQRTDLWLLRGKQGQKTEGLEVRSQQIRTTIQRMGKQQDPSIYHRELYSVHCVKPQWKRIWVKVEKQDLHICTTMLRQITSGKLLYSAGNSARGCDDLHGWDGGWREGGSRGKGYVYMHSRFTLLSSRN